MREDVHASAFRMVFADFSVMPVTANGTDATGVAKITPQNLIHSELTITIRRCICRWFTPVDSEPTPQPGVFNKE